MKGFTSFPFLEPCNESDGLTRLHASRGQTSPTSQEDTEILLALIDALLEEGGVVTQGPAMYPWQVLKSYKDTIACTTYVWCSRQMSDLWTLTPSEKERALHWQHRLEARKEQVQEKLTAQA